MNIVIPLGGIGKRFQKAGYNTPKALVHCHGSPLLDKALSSIGNLENTQIYIAFHKVLDNWAFSERILEKYPEIRLLTLTRSTCGAADTLAIVAKKIEEERQNFPLISIDSDIFFKFSIQEILEKQENKNCCFYFEDQQKKPLYSYIKLNENQEVVDIAEKVKISQFANIGIYSFSSTKLYSKLFQDTVSKKQKASNSEIFISHVIKQAIKNGEKFSGINIHPEDYHCLGTPSQLRQYASVNAKSEKMRFCFDLDRTLVTPPKILGDYTSVTPIESNIRFLRSIKRAGHTVIIHTARRMRTHKANMGSVLKDIAKITLDTLEQFDIPYDEIYFGKPHAHFYIDDRAVNAYEDLQKLTGFYCNDIEERSHNSITRRSSELIEKSSEDHSIKGEIYWYRNCPKVLSKFIPDLVSSNIEVGKLKLKRFEGLSLSHLFLCEELNRQQLYELLDILRTFHSCEDPANAPVSSIYENYIPKINERFQSDIYLQLEGSSKFHKQFLKFFREYQKKQKAIPGIIHGDPVFTNVLVNEKQEFCLLDMKGILGNNFSVWGDIHYDFAKVLQSIIGYDEILLGKSVSTSYREKILQYYENYIVDKFGLTFLEDTRVICSSLIFSLIPLHDPTLSKAFFSLCQKIPLKEKNRGQLSLTLDQI